MLRRCVTICLYAGLCTSIMWAQNENREPTVAYVYVSAHPASGSENQVEAFAAKADGRLIAVPGSPFHDDDTALSVNGGYLNGIHRNAPTIDTFAIASNGATDYLRSTNYAIQNPHDCGSAAWLFSDRSGADLYAMEFDGDCANNAYASFAPQNTTGKLSYLGAANGGAGSFSGAYLPATFLGNNLYAYEATNNGCMYYGVSGFRRESSGLLVDASISAKLPEPPLGYRIYIPTFAAADPSDHVAITLIPANSPGCPAEDKLQIASFTAAANGELTATNTYATMPDTSVTSVTDLKISPAGNLLAVGGAQGLQLFHFNGASPVTPYTGILTVDPITQMFWDTKNHLYAISGKADRLHVFDITPTSVHEAPGSPYPIHSPEYLAVRILP